MSVDGLSDHDIRDILSDCRRIAMVGLSDNPARASYGTAQYMIEQGYQIIPVNPNYDEVLGLRCAPNLEAIEEPIDMVNLFQRSDVVPQFVEPASSTTARVFWMQLDIVNHDAAKDARGQGMTVVMDRCLKIEHSRLSIATSR